MSVTVQVWGERYELSVLQESESVWIARGEYKGKPFQGQGRSATAAAASWREQARYS